jgi:hypothetical protein
MLVPAYRYLPAAAQSQKQWRTAYACVTAENEKGCKESCSIPAQRPPRLQGLRIVLNFLLANGGLEGEST